MVVLLDLDDEGLESPEKARNGATTLFSLQSLRLNGTGPYDDKKLRHLQTTGITSATSHEGRRENLNISGFSAALACYPVVIELAKSIDLNTLHALSRTCHTFRSVLLQSRTSLIARTLRCSNEDPSTSLSDETTEFPSHHWNVIGSIPRITSGKVGPCARDMVGECRRCSRIVCRNCVMKVPSSINLPKRLRRLCPTCSKAPLHQLISPHLPGSSPTETFTYSAFSYEPCQCKDIVFICQPCGHALTNSDTTYRRIWHWRTRYSMTFGLGTGIGEGNEGVKCGRGKNCLDAEDFVMELDSEEEDNNATVAWTVTPADTEEPENSPTSPDAESEKAGYLRQEIEGIGGVVRQKIKKRVRLGRTVKEHVDEREKAEYLGREMRGESRAWCGWCDRVVLAKGDRI